MTASSEAITLSEHDITAHAGEQIFGVSRYTDDLDPNDDDLDSIHTFSAQMPDRDRIHPDWVGKISATNCSKHLNGLSGDGPSVFQQMKKGDHSDNITIAMQNVTGSCKPYHKTGYPNDDCRFAAWTAMVKSGLVDIAFLVDAHCDPIDIQKCQAYTKSSGGISVKGAPTTEQTSRRLFDPVEGLPVIGGIQTGGILMLISPALRQRVVRTTHRCSGRLFLVHLQHNDTHLVIIAVYGVSAPASDDKKMMRDQLADATADMVAEYSGKPIIVVGDYNAAASSIDRATDKMYPYDENAKALTNLLTRLSFTDLHRHKYKIDRHYTWNNTTGSRSRIDVMYANSAVFGMMGGPKQYKFSIGNTAGPLGTDHSPIFATFRAPLASPNDGSLPLVFSPPPATPTKWKLDSHKSAEYHDLLIHHRDHPKLHDLANQRAIFVRARNELHPLAYAATILDLRRKHTTSDIHDAVTRAYDEPRYDHAHINIQRDTILSHITTTGKDEFDAADFIKQYEKASTIWHTSLAEGLRTAYGMVNQPKHRDKPLPSKSNDPERVRLAMSICHHWHRLTSISWSSPQPASLHRRIRRIRQDAIQWGTTPIPPAQPNPTQHESKRTWETWALSVIPALHRLMISSGVAHVNGIFCTHPIDDNTRLATGPSLGGALRPGGSNTMIDGLLIPHSTSTDETEYQWNCSDADLRRHMANEIMKLSSDKTTPSSSSTQTYPFTKIAKTVLFDPAGPHNPSSNETPNTTEPNTHVHTDAPLHEPTVPDPPTDTHDSSYIPVTPEQAKQRADVEADTIEQLGQDTRTVATSSWGSLDTWDLMDTIPKRAKQMGFSIPTHVTSYSAIPSSIILRFDLEQYTTRHSTSSTFSLCHILRNHTPGLTNLRAGLPSPAVNKKLHTHWYDWARPIAAQCDAISTHPRKSAKTMAEALRPPP